MRYEWWGFLLAGDCPAALPLINLLAKPDCFSLVFCTKKLPACSSYGMQADLKDIGKITKSEFSLFYIINL
jgi:hypothetical protein